MNWIKNYVGNLHIVPYGRYRGDCPICGRINTFSVTDTGFERLWHCFHADCYTKGSTGMQLTKENSKVAFKELGDGSKGRICKKCPEVIE